MKKIIFVIMMIILTSCNETQESSKYKEEIEMFEKQEEIWGKSTLITSWFNIWDALEVKNISILKNTIENWEREIFIEIYVLDEIITCSHSSFNDKEYWDKYWTCWGNKWWDFEYDWENKITRIK